MFEFAVDVHEGAIRLTIREQQGWLLGGLVRLLTGSAPVRTTEIYLERRAAIALGTKLMRAGEKMPCQASRA